MNIWKLFLFSLVALVALVACAPQEDDAALPTLAVLPSVAPSDVPPQATILPTSDQPTPLPTPTAEVMEVQQLPVEVEDPAPGGGQVLAGCAGWGSWDASRVELRDATYGQPPAGDGPAFLAAQIREYREALALVDYDECLIEARMQYLLALDEAALALEAADRTTAQLHEENAAQAMMIFEQELSALSAQ